MLRDRIMKGEVVLGTMISEFTSPNLLRIFQMAGYSFVIIDGEHGPFNSESLSAMISMGNAIGLPVIVRVPGIYRGFITRTLDMGAEGFLVPMVNSADEAREVVSYTKYTPLGKRGISLTRSHTNYNPPKLDEYMKAANKRTLILAQIETREALKNASEIAAVAGIDCLIVGPSDLSSDLGQPGNLKNEELLSSAARTAESAIAAGKRCGTVSGNMEYLSQCRKAGMNLFCVSSELGMLVKAAKENVKVFHEKVS